MFSLGRLDLVVYLKVCTITNMDLLYTGAATATSHLCGAGAGRPVAAQVNSQYLVILWHGGKW